MSQRLIRLRHWLFLALLAALYLVLWTGPGTRLGRTLMVIHLGLFMLWQPFVHAEKRISTAWLVGLSSILLLVGAFLQGWMIALWIMMLAGIVGGKVMLFDARMPRIFYLMALGFLIVLLLLLAAPLAVPMVAPPAAMLSLSHLGLPLILMVMVLLPRVGETDSESEIVDFVYSLFVFLLLAVLVLGSLAAMLLLGSGYVEALLQTLLVTGVMLFLLGLAWNPSSGFAGLGGLFSRYVMSIGLPVEQWLQALNNLAVQEEDPQAFVAQACAEFTRRLLWVKGGEWIAGESRGTFGILEGRRLEFSHDGMVLVLYTENSLSPTLIWHCNVLAQLLARFHADKQRALTLKQMSYMQAIHETGARLTHDVKNLLQSLNALCSAGSEPGAESSPAYQSLLRRQLPAISERLAETLAKLSAPHDAPATSRWVDAGDWWAELGHRMTTLGWIEFKADMPLVGQLPGEVFSGVADNLMRNVTEKHLREPELRVSVELKQSGEDYSLVVCDNGSAVPEEIAAGLFAGPVPSESGYGTGLYHASRHAQAAGYRLNLIENRAGQVCFRLSRASY